MSSSALNLIQFNHIDDICVVTKQIEDGTSALKESTNFRWLYTFILTVTVMRIVTQPQITKDWNSVKIKRWFKKY